MAGLGLLGALGLEVLGAAAGAALGALVEQAGNGEPLCFACARKAGLVAGAATVLTAGLGRVPAVQRAAGRLVAGLGASRVGQWAAAQAGEVARGTRALLGAARRSTIQIKPGYEHRPMTDPSRERELALHADVVRELVAGIAPARWDVAEVAIGRVLEGERETFRGEMFTSPGGPMLVYSWDEMDEMDELLYQLDELMLWGLGQPWVCLHYFIARGAGPDTWHYEFSTDF